MDSFNICFERVFEIPEIVKESLEKYKSCPKTEDDLLDCFSHLLASIIAYTCTPKECLDTKPAVDRIDLSISDPSIRVDGDIIHTSSGGVVTSSYVQSMLRSLLRYEYDIYLAYDYKKINEIPHKSPK